jgi:hypothetical protein
MSDKKEMVVTAYGHDNVIDKIAVSSFDGSTGKDWQYKYESDAQTYCKTVNGLKLMEGSWVYARIVPENTPVALDLFLPSRFSVLIQKTTDKVLQKVFMKIDKEELATALKGCSEEVLEKVSRNMSTGAYQMLKDHMESLGPEVIRKDVTVSQDKIISALLHFEDAGENTINPWEGGY